ncbi:MAG TPA: hypothetical protein VKA10_09250, partial [Prolixibacteraceae bacterium]|nr:hypothetical protein [Prolixibacteraceae bacterium]
MEIKSVFSKRTFEPGKDQFIEIDKYKLGVRREKEGWFLVFGEKKEGEEDETIDVQKEGEYYQSGKSNSLLLVPALPVKPLVFKGSKLFVTTKQRVTFFLKIPLNIVLYYSKFLPENKLKEIAPARLSDTWFGDPDIGEPAFSLGNEYFLNPDKIETTNLTAICPITIFNNSGTILEVERLIIRTDNLALYLYSKKIITSLVEIEYKGKDVVSSVDFKYSKSFHGEKQEILAKPRNTAGLNLL